MSFNIKSYLQKHRSIMSYIYDAKGFKRGIIVARPDDENKEPLIGWAFFEEVITRGVKNNNILEEHFFGNIFDIPVFRDALNEIGRTARGRSTALNFRNFEVIRNLPLVYIENIRYPFEGEISREAIRNCILLASSRCNANVDNYYIDGTDDVQSISVMKDNADNLLCIALKASNLVGLDTLSRKAIADNEYDYLIDYITNSRDVIKIRQKIKNFAYRANRYYKYIPGYRSTQNTYEKKSST